MTQDKIGTYQVSVRVDQPGLLGSPVLTLDLIVNAANNEITGRGEIGQSVTPTQGPYIMDQLTGTAFVSGFQNDMLIVHLEGEYAHSARHGMGTSIGPFSASLFLSRDWNGEGSYSYGRYHVSNCRAANTSEAAPKADLVAELATA